MHRPVRRLSSGSCLLRIAKIRYLAANSHDPMPVLRLLHASFMSALVGFARVKAISGYIGDGFNRWPACSGPTPGTCSPGAGRSAAESPLDAIADEGVPIRAIAEVIGRHLDLPQVAVAAEDATGCFSRLATTFLAMDRGSSTAPQAAAMTAKPPPGLIEDLEKATNGRLDRR